jgi:hypothetical protein
VVTDGNTYHWSNSHERQLLERLGGIKDLKIQKIKMPIGLLANMETFIQDYPGTTTSDLARHCVTVYFQKVVPNQELSKIVEDIFQSTKLQTIVAEEKIKIMSFRCKPRFFRDVHAWASLEGMAVPDLVVQATYRIMGIIECKSELEKILRQIREELEQRLVAA